jgi:hypothetical protein
VDPDAYAHLVSREQWEAWLSRRLRAEADVLGGPLSQDNLLSAGMTYARAASAIVDVFIDGHLQHNAWLDAHPDRARRPLVDVGRSRWAVHVHSGGRPERNVP